ncbi:hypothetical protein [Streptomyces luteireticuli]|uniref:WXG100 family type VII secretion target n=1 Tax=Streptomyces luteireticuli TaxID=173858 RepID=A0ABN0Z4H5_9ACTN
MTDNPLSERFDRAFNPDRYADRVGARDGQLSDDQLKLASSGSSGSGGANGTHKATAEPWTAASGVAGQLHQDMEAAVKELGHAHEGLKGATEGLASASALASIREGWDERFSAVRERCGHLDEQMKAVGAGFHQNEVHTKGSFKR